MRPLRRRERQQKIWLLARFVARLSRLGASDLVVEKIALIRASQKLDPYKTYLEWTTGKYAV